MSIYLFLFVPIFYVLMYKIFWCKRLLESIVFGLVIFLGINSFYFFITSIFNIKVSILSLFFVDIVYGLLMYLIGSKKKKIVKVRMIRPHYEFMIAIIAVVLSVLFMISVKQFANGFRFPVISYTEDASQHLNFTFKIFQYDKTIGGLYPFAFHGNAWVFIKLATQITGITDDFVFITNIFVMYIWLILFLTLSIISIIIFDLINNEKTNKFYLQVIVSISTIIVGSVISLYHIEFGYFSTWLNQLFAFGIIYLLLNDNSKSIILSIPLLFGFFFSYSYFMPVLVVFYGYLYVSKKEKKYLYLLLISLILAITFLIEIFFSANSVNGLIVASGGFPTYSKITVFTYILFSFFYMYLVKRKNIKSKTLGYLSFLGGFFLFYSVGMAILQLAFKGKVFYSFYKVFASSFLFFGVIATAGFVLMIIEFFINKKERISLPSIFIKLITIVLVIMYFFDYIKINPPLLNLIRGRANFFSNGKEKYNTVIYALENFSNYKNVIYIDGDYQSTRWATLSYLPLKFNLIYDFGNIINYTNYEYYISQLKITKSNTIILNPTRFLESDCKAENLIKIATQSADKILIYPFDLKSFKQNCHQNIIVK